MLVAFLKQIRQVEIIAVKVNQMRVGLAEGEEILKQGSLIRRRPGKPLFDPPVSSLIIGGSDQIK